MYRQSDAKLTSKQKCSEKISYISHSSKAPFLAGYGHLQEKTKNGYSNILPLTHSHLGLHFI